MALPDTLASDAERERTADRLRAAAGEGRLTPDELAERVGAAYAARTHGELEAVLAGLPEPPARVRSRRERSLRRLRVEAVYLLPPVLICILVWAFTGADPSFWPRWVIFGVLVRLILVGRGVLLGPAPPRGELPARRRPR